jgi:Ca2+-binding RTX toxin-like protein
MAANFDNPYSANLVGLWDFRVGQLNDDTGLADGIAQDGAGSGGMNYAGGWMLSNGTTSQFNVPGDSDDPFDISTGTLITSFRSNAFPGDGDQTVVSRGLSTADDADGESFVVRVTDTGAVQLSHADGGNSVDLETPSGFFNLGDVVTVTYGWNPSGVSMEVENTTQGTSFRTEDDTDGMTLDVAADGEDSFVIAANGDGGESFNGAIDYVAVLDDDVVGPVGGLNGIVEGGAGDDLIDINYTGDPEGDRIDNNDAINPADGANDDSVEAGDGDDTVLAGVGNDTIYGGDGSDSVEGGTGDDVIDTSSGDPLPLPDRGFDGYTGTTPNIPFVPADLDPYNDRDTVLGGDGDDLILTGDDNDLISGGAGEDTILAGIDDDTVDGGADDDVITGGEGSDLLQGGAGNDTLYGGLDPAFPDGLNITDDGSDGRPVDPDPTNGMDTIDGGVGDDVIYGQDDDDVISGGEGDDTIDAGIDDDEVTGGSGNDVITGGHGADTLSGGADRDLFIGGSDGDQVDGGSTGDDFDTLDLTGVNFEITSEIEDADGNSYSGTIDLLDGADSVIGTMSYSEIERIIPCFTPGTLIATPDGERRVEDLAAGDRIITRDNGIQAIRWFGQQTLGAADLKGAEHLQPILIREGALGNGLPERDMMVSPNHRVLVANDKTALYFEDREVLVAAKHLIGLAGVDAVETSSVTYIHFMFDQHEVVLSDGAWTESFQPGDQTLRGLDNAQRNEIFEIFPELKSEQGIDSYSSARRSLKRHEARLLVH